VDRGPILGPSLGGWITDNYSWHWVFLINVPIGILSLTLVGMFVDEPPALVKRAKELVRNGLKDSFHRLRPGGAVPGLPGSDAGPRSAQ